MARFVSIGLISLVIGWTAIILSPAYAQSQCAPHDALLAKLATQFQEKPVALATAGHGAIMVELTLSAAGTWTLIGTTTAGLSCIHAAGDDWQATGVPPKPGQPS